MSTWPEQQNKIEAALGETAGAGMVVRWVAVVDVMREDGSRDLGLVSSASITSWELTGMLSHALEIVGELERGDS